MVPAGAPTHETIDALGELLAAGDVVVDGGNSKYTDDQRARRGPRDRQGSASSTAASPAASGAWTNGYALMVGGDDAHVARAPADLRHAQAAGRLRLRARRRGRRRPLRQDGPQRHRVRHDAGLRRGLGAARGGRHRHRRARGLPLLAARAPSSGPGCSTCWCGRSTRTRTSTSCAATPRTPARAAGRWRPRSTTPCRCRSITAALFARFASRQDDSPAMKMIAALRNQFGGHAVTSAAVAKGATLRRRRRRLDRLSVTDVRPHLSLTDFRSYPAAELPLDAGVTALVGPNGQGKTNLVEAIGYLATLGSHRVAPATRRWCGSAPSGRSCAARGARRPADAGRARDQPGQGQPGPDQPGTGAAAARGARDAAHRAVRAGGPGAGQGRSRSSGAGSSTTCSSRAPRASRRCAPTTTGCSSSATRC